MLYQDSDLLWPVEEENYKAFCYCKCKNEKHSEQFHRNLSYKHDEFDIWKLMGLILVLR